MKKLKELITLALLKKGASLKMKDIDVDILIPGDIFIVDDEGSNHEVKVNIKMKDISIELTKE